MTGPRLWWGIEHKREDCWVGAFWRWTPVSGKRLEIWICLVPMLPIHLTLHWRIEHPYNRWLRERGHHDRD